MQKTRYALVAANVLAVLSLTVIDAVAEGECPAGFVFLGQAYASADATNSEAKVPAKEVRVNFPPRIKINFNYVQSGGRWAGGTAQAAMTDGDVPKGLMILAGGSEGGAKGWAVHNPEIIVIDQDDDVIVQRAAKIKLYCHTGSGELDKLGKVDCNVHANFCAMLR